MDDRLTEECIKYFKNTAGFKRTLEGIRKKYKSLGSLGGTVVLKNLKEEEKEALTGLFRKDCSGKGISFKVDKFINALQETRFEGVDFERVLQGYFGEKLISKKEEKFEYEQQKNAYFNEIASAFQHTRAEKWFRYVLETKESGYRILNQKYDEDKRSLKDNLYKVCRAYNYLSFDKGKVVRLALLSSMITKNPHSFDINTDNGILLVYAICYSLKERYPANAEQLNEVLYRAGIIRDEVSNFTLCSGLLAYSGGVEHPGWRGFYDRGEPLQVSIWNLSSLDQIISPLRRVYVFENPTVFSEVLYNFKEDKIPIMCTFGNFKLASLIVLDKLVESGSTIYYSGDFDPEGIIMADKIKQRYGGKAVLWRYGVKEYNKIISSVSLADSRLKKLDNVKSCELENIVNLLKTKKKAAYQELLVNEYVKDINDFIRKQ
ncbi:TIGR02679 domain-containing protein [Clostridium oryzae]|uniref:TIGR02679 family protein n=1 Tax=Clostridium oryzae TaxID=1450648 RepID=A0A1V4IM98_9CLOT|nr:TIGR02679 domain-containing protein [Clostridium oryzae]OPJ60964.1 hypothetical protein CLORY_25120 [Clostridium oryzae]